jgi:hypothetical protein
LGKRRRLRKQKGCIVENRRGFLAYMKQRIKVDDDSCSLLVTKNVKEKRKG